MGERKEKARHFDNETNTWYFDCEHDASNTSTYESCGPWPENKLPATTQIWYDDAVSSEKKFAAIKAAGWRGVGFWQASGMWPGCVKVPVSQARRTGNPQCKWHFRPACLI